MGLLVNDKTKFLSENVISFAFTYQPVTLNTTNIHS